MLTHLALAVAPILCGPQDSATLHTAQADLFVDVPEVTEFLNAWQDSAIARIVMDESLGGLFSLAGVSGPEEAFEQLHSPELKQALAIASNVKGFSLSVTIDDGAVDNLIDEFRSVLGSSQPADLEFLDSVIEGVYLSTGDLPVNLDVLGVGEYMLLDAYGRRFHYEPGTDGTFTLLAMGADGELGGEGASQDVGVSVAMAPLLVTRIAALAGLELVIEWHKPELVGPMLGMILGRVQDEFPFVELSTLASFPIDAEVPFPATAFRVDPTEIGGPTDAQPIEFSLQMVGARTFVTFGTIRGQDLTGPITKALAGEVDSNSLAATEQYKRAMEHTAGSDGTIVWRGFVNTAMANSTSVDDDAPTDALLDYMGISSSSGGWVTRISNGLYISDSCNSASPSQIQADASVANIAEWVPNDAVFVEAGTMDPAGMWAVLEGIANEDQTFAELVNVFGSDLSEGLISNLGSEFAVWVNPVGGLSIPELYAIVSVKDGDAVMATLDSLLDQIAEASNEISVSRRPYKGVNYTSVDIGIPIGVMPTFTILDGKLWISNSSVLIKREIRRRSKGEDYERGAHPMFARLAGPGGNVPANLRSAGFLDLGNVLSSYYKGALALSGILSAGVSLPDGLIEALPPETIFSDYIVPTYSETRLEDGVLITHKTGSFGPEPLLLGVGLGLGVFAAFTVQEEFLYIDQEPWEEHATDTPHFREIEVRIGAPQAEFDTMITTPILEVGLLLYSIENGDYPASLEALLKPSKAYPGGYIGESSVPIDGWGNPFHYELVKGGDYSLYSMGPNGLDDGGAGDDVHP